MLELEKIDRLPSRPADATYEAIPGIGRGGKEEGSIRGGFGLGSLDGDDD